MLEAAMPHRQGLPRDAIGCLPNTLEEWIAADNPVRVIDAFVDSLNLGALGFTRVIPADTGCPAYPASCLIKLYLYGYTNGLRASRKLERETQRNIEVMWLLGGLTPDHHTIADFRKEQPAALRAICQQFTQFCKDLELFGGELVAVDGSQFAAVNSRQRNFTIDSVKKRLGYLAAALARYSKELDEHRRRVLSLPSERVADLKTKLEQLGQRRERYQTIQAQLEANKTSQISLTDPDARSMPTGNATMIAYNVQIAVDDKHHLIVAEAVTNEVTDKHQLFPTARAAQETLGVESLEVVADGGYYDGEQVQRCAAHGLTVYVPKPRTSANHKQGLFTKDHFAYDAEQDVYRCPAGQELTYRFSTVEDGRPMRYYAAAVCRTCSLKPRCTRNQGNRRLTRWEYEAISDAMAKRIRDQPERVKLRKQLAEHPFGTFKRGFGFGYFLLKGLVKVAAEVSLMVFAYNFKRAVNILGVLKLLAALREHVSDLLFSARWRLSNLLAMFLNDVQTLFTEFSHSLALC